MTRLARLRFCAPLCGALLLAHAPVMAQNAAPPLAVGAPSPAASPATDYKYPAPPETPEAAGALFYQLLTSGAVVQADPTFSRPPFDLNKATPFIGALSQAQVEAISKQPYNGMSSGILELMALLARQKDEPQFEARVTGKEGEATLVEVAPAPARKREVVVVPEDGGFRVDLKATYGRWNDLSGEKLDIAWADLTGVISPALAQNAQYIEKRRRDGCQTNLKQIMLGILQYAQDYDETYPPATKWIDTIMPYVKSNDIFRCPALPAGSNYGYSFNQNLNAITMARLDNPAQTIAIYETDALERNAYGVGEERAYRHGGGSNIAFADGHIKWYPQGEEPADQVNFKP